MATHLPKSRAKHTEKKKKPLLRRLASDNRVKGFFIVLSVFLVVVGLFAIQKQQIYKSEASDNYGDKPTYSVSCSGHTLTITGLTAEELHSSTLQGGFWQMAFYNPGDGLSNKCDSVDRNTIEPRFHDGKTVMCRGTPELGSHSYSVDLNSNLFRDVVSANGNVNVAIRAWKNRPWVQGDAQSPRGEPQTATHCRSDVPTGGGGGSGSGDRGDACNLTTRKCKSNLTCFGYHGANDLGVCATSSDTTGGSDGPSGKDSNAGKACTSSTGKSGICWDTSKDHNCSQAFGGKGSLRTGRCPGPAKVQCCVNTGADPATGGSDGNGLPPGPATGSVGTTGDQINSGGGSASHAPAGKTSANCSISQKPSSITPSGTVKPGSKTLRWSAVSKVTKYKVTVNSTARDVTGTSMPLTVKDKKTYNIKVQAYICGKAGNAKTATIKGDVNKGGTPTGGACKAEGTQCGLHGGSNPGSQCCSKVCIDNKCAAEGTPTAEPTDTPIASIEASLKISLRFQGLNSTSSKKFLSEKTRVTLVHTPSNTVFEPKTVDFRIVDALRWEGEARFAGVASGSGYLVAIKGPQHVQRLICDDQPAETSGSIGGLYKCERDGDDHQIGGITLGRGANILDFDGITQFAGDLPEQDGVIDSLDLANVRQSLGSTESDALEMADLNLDGVVNTADFSLVIQGLERYRADENYTGVQLEEE